MTAAFEAHLLLIGRLNYAWTNTESVLVHLIAGLAKTDKETATVVFLTLNTARARITLVERLAKMEHTDPALRDAVLAATRRMNGVSRLRNRYNHCIYAFDDEGGGARTILMRVQDNAKRIRMGQASSLDEEALDDVRDALREIDAINRDLWTLIAAHDLPQ